MRYNRRVHILMSRFYRALRKREGQSLIEILVAVGVGVILVVGAIATLSPSINTHANALRVQAASGLAKELLENVRAAGEGNWHTLDALATSSSNKYYLIASTSPFTATSGMERVLLATTSFTRYFYLDDVYRNVSGKIDAAGTTLDPSTKKITVTYGWGSGTTSVISYLTRALGSVWTQTDWSAGSGQDGPITATGTNAKFSTSSNIDYSTSSGAMVIQGF
jgi:type II secretory pathway pseudopilin PulG